MSTGKNTCSSPSLLLEMNDPFLLKLLKKKKIKQKTQQNANLLKEQPMEKFSLNYYNELARTRQNQSAKGRKH